MKRALIIVGVLLGLWLLYEQRPVSNRIRISPQTTRLTAPLADDGLPDYTGALLTELSEGVTPENNGAIPFLRAMWPAELPEDHQGLICRELGMEIPSAEGLCLPGDDEDLVRAVGDWFLPGTNDRGDELNEEHFEARRTALYARDANVETLFAVLANQPWTAEDAPPVATWIASHAANYDLLHVAAERPRFYLPSATLLLDPKQSWIHITLSGVNSLRTASACLLVRAHLRCGEGAYEAAWDDCRAMFELSEHVHPTTLIEDLVSAAIEKQATDLAVQLLDQPELGMETAKEMLAYFSSRPQRSSFAESLDRGERGFFLTTMLVFSRQRQPHDGQEAQMLSPLAARRVDWNIVLEMGNDAYDKMVDAARLPNGPARDDAWDRVWNELDELQPVDWRTRLAAVFLRGQRSRLVGQTLLDTMLPALNAAERHHDRRNVYRRLLPVAAALAAYRAEHNEYPATLAGLTPTLLADSPADPNGIPLAYQQKGAGYLLYSFGDDRQDDEGCHGLDDRLFGYEVDTKEPLVGWGPAVIKALGMEDDPRLYDEYGSGPLLELLEIPDGADDLPIRLPLIRLDPPKPSETTSVSAE